MRFRRDESEVMATERHVKGFLLLDRDEKPSTQDAKATTMSTTSVSLIVVMVEMNQ
jgi:hypothetical protein